MAQVGDSSSSGRNANTDLNIVPFIDLMSVLITFLLITAVWSQVSMIQLGSSIYGKKTESSPEKPPPPTPHADIPLRLDVRDVGFRLVVGAQKFEIPKTEGHYDAESLMGHLKKVKHDYQEKVDAVITVDDEVAYEFLILGMDTLNQAGFPSISVSTVGAQ
jgi:biopolymer transport protein TolR